MRAPHLVVLVAIAACSAPEPTTGPVAAQPLAGNIGRMSFVAKSARAKIQTLNGVDRAEIEIFPIEVGCDRRELPTPAILATVPWRAGAVREYTQAEGDMSVGILTEGAPPVVETARAEVLEAPLEPGSFGRLRLRTHSHGDEIAGEIIVRVCE